MCVLAPPVTSLSRRADSRSALLALTMLLTAGHGLAQQPHVHRIAREGVLGTSSDLVVRAADEAVVDRVEHAVFAEVERLDAVLSTWRDDSELALLIASGGGRASTELAAVLGLAERWRARTNGAYEPGVGRLVSLWRGAGKRGVAPSQAQLAEVVAGFAEASWTSREQGVTVRAPFSIDAIAKGYVVDRAFAAGVAAAGEDAEVLSFQIGGDLRVGKAPRDVGVVDPRYPSANASPLCTLRLAGRAIASSGGYERPIHVGEQAHSHIFDPRTGRPADGVLGASVVAADVVTADVLATLMCALGPERGLALVAEVEGAEAVIVAADGAAHESRGWAKLRSPEELDPLRAQPWPAGFRLDVHFELKGPADGARGGRRRGGWRRPYVAVWVEDLTGAPAKTLCLWIEKVRWLRDLRRWNRQYRDLPHVLDAVSSATRRAGAYKVSWDGTDDDGRRLPPGRYTVCIEVVREHGNYELIRRDVVLSDEAVRVLLPGNDELETASLRFGLAARRSQR